MKQLPRVVDVFRVLAKGPQDWVVLHSLDLAPWNRNGTEIDFVILMPENGILCIEVKSHEFIDFDGEKWIPSSIKRDPFSQAIDGSQTFYRNMSGNLRGLGYVPVIHICIFPRARFELAKNISRRPYELIDKRKFRACEGATDFCRLLTQNFEENVAENPAIKSLDKRLSDYEKGRIVDFCLPVRKRIPEARVEVERRREEVEDLLRIQQKPVLKLALKDHNSKLIVRGPAGTGKTLIALELAKRAAESGRRTAMLCFNQLVGDWLLQQIESSGSSLPNLVVGRVNKVLADMAEIDIPIDPKLDFWESKLPDLLEDKITSPEFASIAEFDYLVLDEAQDIFARPRLWDCLKHWISGGLEHGSYTLFGDFDYQVISNPDAVEKALEEVQSFSPTSWGLDENCRNYESIGVAALKLSGLPDRVYTDYLRSGGGSVTFGIKYYENDDEQASIAKEWLIELAREGYKPSEITLLSFRGDDSCLAGQLAREGVALEPFWKFTNKTSFASVYSFKGMENKAILLTDGVLREDTVVRDLFYTGMTRSTDILRLLVEKGSKPMLAKWLKKRD